MRSLLIFITVVYASAASAVDISGEWVTPDGVKLWIFHDPATDELAGASVYPSNPPTYSGFEGRSQDGRRFQIRSRQKVGPSSCVTTFRSVFSVMDRNNLRVEINGAEGGCGYPTDFHYEYPLRRVL